MHLRPAGREGRALAGTALPSATSALGLTGIDTEWYGVCGACFYSIRCNTPHRKCWSSLVTTVTCLVCFCHVRQHLGRGAAYIAPRVGARHSGNGGAVPLATSLSETLVQNSILSRAHKYAKRAFPPDLESTRMVDASLKRQNNPPSASAAFEAFGCRCLVSSCSPPHVPP